MSTYKGPRKRMTLRMGSNLGEAVNLMAAKAGLSVNEFINREIEKQVERDELAQGDTRQP